MGTTLPFLYQLQNATFATLSGRAFRVGVVDMDDSGLSASQVQALHDQSKIVYTYLSIGEAEDYRGYWIDGHWSQQKPSFVLGENPDWDGNYRVKFWDPEWQSIVFSRVDEAIARGYDGVYLDIVDGYEVAEVRTAYQGDDIRQAMIDFVIALSRHAKAADPDFKIVPQNALGLLALTESATKVPNADYLQAIDGVGVEDLWFDGNAASSWTSDDVALLQNAIGAEKFVLATSYPTVDAKQDEFVSNAIEGGFIPFVADRDLSGVIDPINLEVEDRMVGHDIVTPWGHVPDGPPANNAPAAVTDSYLVEGGAALVVEAVRGVLANDRDADGDALFAILVAPPSHGNVALSHDGSFIYTADLGYSGEDSFTYKANDGAADSDVAVVRLTVSPQDGTPGVTRIEGGPGDDTLTGSDAADILVGGGGNDTFAGQGGEDLFLIGTHAGADAFDGGPGVDRIVATANAAVIGIRSLEGVEVISGQGFAGVTIAASGGGRTLDLSGVRLTEIARIVLEDQIQAFTGSDANDVIVGGAGDDVLKGGKGNDTFKLASGQSSIVIDGGEGFDAVVVAGARQTLGWASISGVEAVSGSRLKIVGTALDETLDFSEVTLTGVFKIYAGAGNDRVIGSAGADTIAFSDGTDLITGGTGVDIFDLDSLSESRTGSLADTITDFEQGVDRISLRDIDASTRKSGNQSFAFIGDAGFSNVTGQLRFDHATPDTTSLYGDVNGDSVADFQINLIGYITLMATDFFL